MEYFQVRYASRVVIYERKMFIRLATDARLKSRPNFSKFVQKITTVVKREKCYFSIKPKITMHLNYF